MLSSLNAMKRKKRKIKLKMRDKKTCTQHGHKNTIHEGNLIKTNTNAFLTQYDGEKQENNKVDNKIRYTQNMDTRTLYTKRIASRRT